MTDEQWKRFCGYSAHADLDRPFVRRGWKYATDGAICIRMPAPNEPDTTARIPDVVPTLFLVWPDEWGPWPSIEQLVLTTCQECEGTGLDPEEAPGTPCFACRGLKMRLDGSVQLGARLIGGRYMQLISTLKDVRYCRYGGSDEPLRFEFAGNGMGIVMPVDPGKVGEGHLVREIPR